MEIQIASDYIHCDIIAEHLENLSNWENYNIDLKTISNPNSFRSIDPAILTATLTATGAALGALLKGLLDLAKKDKESKITIRDKDGVIIEFPTDCPLEKLERLFEIVNKNKPRVEIIRK